MRFSSVFLISQIKLKRSSPPDLINVYVKRFSVKINNTKIFILQRSIIKGSCYNKFTTLPKKRSLFEIYNQNNCLQWSWIALFNYDLKLNVVILKRNGPDLSPLS